MKEVGYIKFYRKSLEHWLYQENRPLTKREAWENILLYCNHSDDKIVIGNEIIECKRGQSIMSLQSWAKQFNWDKSKVRRFFILLENDSMIITENVQKTTRLTICNYDHYQGERNGEATTEKYQTMSTPAKKEKNLQTNSNVFLNKQYFKVESINEAFNDYLKLRIKNKYTMTDRAIKILEKKLRDLSGGNTEKALKIIDNAILSSWKSFFPLKENE